MYRDLSTVTFPFKVNFLGNLEFIMNEIVTVLAPVFKETITVKSLANQIPSVLKGFVAGLIHLF